MVAIVIYVVQVIVRNCMRLKVEEEAEEVAVCNTKRGEGQSINNIMSPYVINMNFLSKSGMNSVRKLWNGII